MPPRPVPRRALGAVAFAAAAMVAVLGLPAVGRSVGVLAVSRPLAAAPAPAGPAGAGDGLALLAPTPSAVPSSAVPSSAAPVPDPDAPTAADREAGILRREVAETGSGVFDVAEGATPAPGTGELHTLRIEVEQGLPVDRGRFADFVLNTLNDPRGWGHDGAMTFARTDGDAPLTLMLASPATSSALCGDLDTRGKLSCRNGPHVVLTLYRWTNGTEEYTDDLTGYRQYLVNHEVGHALGHAHEHCPGAGAPAPVMQQQTLGLKGCAPNSWPHPEPSPSSAGGA